METQQTEETPTPTSQDTTEEAVSDLSAAIAEQPTDTQPTDTQTTDSLSVQLEGYDVMDVPKSFIDEDTGEFKINSLLKAFKDTKSTLDARAPEKYELETVFEENNLSFDSVEQEQETVDLFKKHRLSQEAVQDLMAMYGTRYTQMMEQIGPQISQEEHKAKMDAEVQKLKQQWGNNAQQNVEAVDKYAKDRFGDVAADVLQTQQGYDMMYQLMNNTKGPTVIRDTEVSSVDLNSMLGEVVANPNYNNPDSADYMALHKKAEQLSKSISQQR